MQFTFTKLFNFAVAAQAIGMVIAAPAADVSVADHATELSPRVSSVGKMCIGPFLRPPCSDIIVGDLPSGCITLADEDPLRDNINSLEVEPGVTCIFFIQAGCTGFPTLPVSGPARRDELFGTPFQNNIESYLCFRKNGGAYEELRNPSTSDGRPGPRAVWHLVGVLVSCTVLDTDIKRLI
ncbi:hypothetical protein C8J56DRAFT_883817 [Mycena floridula]|nr:hypothetical protein C8J56DRAFT_883817 [Mycena floridula]